MGERAVPLLFDGKQGWCMMPIAWITGVSGAGKTSVAAELRQRGWRALDTDGEPGLARWIDPRGNVVERPDEPTEEWLSKNRWAWDASRFDELVSQIGSERVVLCGNASNELEFLERMDRILLLEIDANTMVRRLDDERRVNDFGTVGDTRDLLIRWLPGYQQRIRSLGAAVIDATASIDVVVESVLSALAPKA